MKCGDRNERKAEATFLAASQAPVVRRLAINGEERVVSARPEARLLDVLRNELGLTGTKEGCGEGECGACSVLVDGRAVNSCLVLFGQLAEGNRIVTVEGLGDAEHLSPLQACFVERGATQCGMCTPGMLITAHAFLLEYPNPTRDEIAEGLAGNLCRCTGYVKIIDAIEAAAVMLRGET